MKRSIAPLKYSPIEETDPDKKQKKLARLRAASMQIQPNQITFGRRHYDAFQENILTLMTEQLQDFMFDKSSNISIDKFGQPVLRIEADKAGGKNHKAIILRKARQMKKLEFSFKWQNQFNKTVDTDGVLVTTVHDIKDTNYVEIVVNPWAVPFLLYFGRGIDGHGGGGTEFNTKIALELKTDYTKRIYKMICSWRNLPQGFFDYNIEKFMEDFNLGPSYQDTSKIKRNILEPARVRIAASDSDVNFTYELIRLAKKNPNQSRQRPDHIRFTIINRSASKTDHTPAQTQDAQSFEDYKAVLRWLKFSMGFPTDNSAILLVQTLSGRKNWNNLVNKVFYYDEQCASGKIPKEHVKNILKKILLEDFNIDIRKKLDEKQIEALKNEQVERYQASGDKNTASVGQVIDSGSPRSRGEKVERPNY